MSAPADDLNLLLALRDSINTAIDSYMALTPEERSKKARVAKARQQIWSAANKLVNDTVVPTRQATLIAFMVSPQTTS